MVLDDILKNISILGVIIVNYENFYFELKVFIHYSITDFNLWFIHICNLIMVSYYCILKSH